MSEKLIIKPPFPTGKAGSFVSSERKDNPIKIIYKKILGESDSLYGEVSFEKTSEGPPGHVHGGCLAAVLDEMMGSCCWANGHKVVAKKIEISFDEMVPVQQSYDLEARIQKIDGRKIFVEGRIFNDQITLTKSSGIFIVLDKEKLEALNQLIG